MYQECIKDAIQGYERLHKFSESLSETKREQLLDSITCKRQLLLQLIGSAYEDLDLCDKAIMVYSAMKAVDLQDRCFSRMVESESDLKKKFKAYAKYGKFLENHGRFEKAL